MSTKKNVLIVDDEMGPRESLRMILKDEYNLQFASNGQEAVDSVKDNNIDLVIMDIRMPVMDGMHALKLIKEKHPFIAVLMVTGYGTIDTAVEAIKVGAFDYISKPFDRFELQEKIHNALDDIKEKTRAHRMMTQIQERSEELATQQESLQEQILQLSKLSSIGMLAQGLAHNLSSPLLVILGRAELMKDKLVNLRSKLGDLTAVGSDNSNGNALLELFSEYDQNIRDTEIIIENVNKLTEVIKNMMNKSRQEQTQEKQFLNLSHILREELRFLEADLYFKHSIDKEIHLEPNVPLIEGVYSDFSQSFLNLIQNALEAMHNSDSKRLTVKTSYDPKCIYVTVHDTGCGIPKQNKDRIFEPYFSTKEFHSEERKSLGAGLGLHMVELLLKPYDASIEVQSKPGDTSFTVKVPYGSGS